MIEINFENPKKILYFKATLYDKSYSLNYNIVEIKYLIIVFDENKNRIKPFDLPFYYDLNVFCISKNKNTIVETFPNYYKDISFVCIEHFDLNEKVELGIKIYKKKYDNYQIVSSFYCFKNINYNISKLHENNNEKLEPIKIQNEYINLINKIKNNKENLTLKNSYIQFPSFISKLQLKNNDDNWIFKNIYNQYYCFCKGIFCQKNISQFQTCKYFYYLSIIDKLRHLYKKTDYLLADFVYENYNDDDILPIFRRMREQNLPAHYMTKKESLYKEYCLYSSKCLIILNEKLINGDLLEKYLDLILRLKVTVAGANFPAINNLFFNIEYITNINIGHGVKFFKSFL